MSTTTQPEGNHKVKNSSFRETISLSHPLYKPEKGRYWLYVALACPWAHRVLITRALKGLTSVIGVSVVHWHMDDKGWRFLPFDENSMRSDQNDAFSIAGSLSDDSNIEANPAGEPARFGIDGTIDHNYHLDRLRDLYFKCEPEYSGRFTVPVLWDLKTETIVNNESADIIRILNNEDVAQLSSLTHESIDLVPAELASEIDEVNGWIYETINIGVYKAGFAEKQDVYEREVQTLYQNLDKLESRLRRNYEAQTKSHSSEKHHPPDKIPIYLVGSQLTEADVRLFPTLIRFDTIYVQQFKSNVKTIRDGYPYIHLWLRNLYWNNAAFHETTNFNHIRWSYTKSQRSYNPNGITKAGPLPDVLPW